MNLQLTAHQVGGYPTHFLMNIQNMHSSSGVRVCVFFNFLLHNLYPTRKEFHYFCVHLSALLCQITLGYILEPDLVDNPLACQPSCLG